MGTFDLVPPDDYLPDDPVEVDYTLPIYNELLQLANDHFGPTAQMFVAVEEASEFIKAAMKYQTRKGPIEDLVAETADLIFLLAEMRYLLDPAAVDACLIKAQNKLKARIEKERENRKGGREWY